MPVLAKVPVVVGVACIAIAAAACGASGGDERDAGTAEIVDTEDEGSDNRVEPDAEGAEPAPQEPALEDEVADGHGGPGERAEHGEGSAPPAREDSEDADLPDGVSERPDWLGQDPLPERADGHGEAQPTPDELTDRRLVSPDPPGGLSDPEGEDFEASVSEVPQEVAERSTWRPECPVGLDELRYVTATFLGFDERPHTGELLVHRRVADDLVAVLEELYEARFPIEEMRVVNADELDAPPTGDGNNTTMFVCRDIAGSSEKWSQHAYGLAIDINPFHNPYVKGDLVLPELAEAYLDRDDDRPGMIQPGDVVTEAFAEIGWGWGGEWQTLKDWHHFSENGL